MAINVNIVEVISGVMFFVGIKYYITSTDNLISFIGLFIAWVGLQTYVLISKEDK